VRWNLEKEVPLVPGAPGISRLTDGVICDFVSLCLPSDQVYWTFVIVVVVGCRR